MMCVWVWGWGWGVVAPLVIFVSSFFPTYLLQLKIQ